MFTGTLDPITNRADWILSAAVEDADTGDLIDLTDVTEFEAIIRDLDARHCERIKVSMTTGEVTITEPGIVQWVFAAPRLKCLCAGTYEFVARITKDDIVTDLLICSLVMVDG